MMKKSFKLFALIMTLLLAAALFAGCGGGEDDDMPAELQEIADNAVSYVADRAILLDGEWGDLHSALIESEEGEDFEEYEYMRGILNSFVLQSGLDYLYALYPTGVPVVAPYMLTVDGSMAPDEYGEEYEWEEGFTEAWHGEAAAADYLWETADGWYALSAYAPIHDSEGEVVAILGIDYPVPDELAEKYSDWIWEE